MNKAKERRQGTKPMTKLMNEALERTSATGDEHLALTLMTMWALSTGRAMPCRPPRCLSAQELIDFWAE